MLFDDDFRKLGLLDWLESDLLLNVVRCEPASSDASFRRYFRITLPDRQLIAMDAPPDKENIARFVTVAELLRPSGIHVPTIYQQNLEDGYLLLEDFGATSYLDKLNPNNADELYGNALDSLFRLQNYAALSQTGLPLYDTALLERELGIFAEWFADKLIGIEMPPALWQSVRGLLIKSALAQPTTCVHRDYHSRNLMVVDRAMPGVIDFQDAVIGPITYDVVSLLRDCYIDWPQPAIENWLQGYHSKLTQAGLIDASLDIFTRWFDLMGVQRHLKAIGIFARLHLRDGKPGYLKDIPRTLGYVLAQSQKYPELAKFHDFLTQNAKPSLPQTINH